MAFEKGQVDVVAHQEASAAVLEAQHWEPPEVSKADGVAETRDEEVEGIVPVAAVLSGANGRRVALCALACTEISKTVSSILAQDLFSANIRDMRRFGVYTKKPRIYD